jgi:hypothetical protein
MSVGTGRQNIIILFWKYQFHFWEYINRNQTFILHSHRPFIFSISSERTLECRVVRVVWVGRICGGSAGILFVPLIDKKQNQIFLMYKKIQVRLGWVRLG